MALGDNAPDGLPPGWTKEIRPRLKCSLKTKMDSIYIDPADGYEFRSLKDVFRYVKTGDIRSCATKPVKREGKLASREELNLLTSTSRTSQVETAVQICHLSEEKPDMKACEKIGQSPTRAYLQAQDQTTGPATVGVQQPESIAKEKFELAEKMKMDGNSEQQQDAKKIKRGHQLGSKQNKTINTVKTPVRASKRLAALRADDLGESGVDEIGVMSDSKNVPNEQLLLSSLAKDFNHSSKLTVGIVDGQCLSAAPSDVVLKEDPDTKSVGLEANKLLQAVDDNLSAEKVNLVEKMHMKGTSSEQKQPTKVSSGHQPGSKRSKIMMPVRASKRLAALKSDTLEECGSEKCGDDTPMSNNQLEANLTKDFIHGNEFPITTLELEHGCVTDQKTKEPPEIGSSVLDVKVIQPEGEDCLAGKIKLVEETMVELNSDKLSHHNKPHKTFTQCSEKVLRADDLGDSGVDERGVTSDSKQVTNEQLLQSSLAKDLNHSSKLTVGIADAQCLSAAPNHTVLGEASDTKSLGLEANKLLQAVGNNLSAAKVNSVEKTNMAGTSNEQSQPRKVSRGHQPGSKRNNIMIPVQASKRLAAQRSDTLENCDDDMPMFNNQLVANSIKDFIHENEFPISTLEHGCVTDLKTKELPDIVSAVLDVKAVHPEGEYHLAGKIKLVEETMVELNGDEQSHHMKPHKTLTKCLEKNKSIKATTIPLQESKQLFKAEGFVKPKINDISGDALSTSNHPSEVNVSKDNQSKYTMAARRLEEQPKSLAATERLEGRCKTPTATERIEEWPKSPAVMEILEEQFKFQLASEKLEECSISEVSTERLEECSKSHLVIERTEEWPMSAVPTERLEERRVELVTNLEHQKKSDKKELFIGDATRKQVELGIDNQKTESQFMSPFGDSWPDPCIEFAFKTLVGDIKESCVGDATRKQVELERIENQKTESQFASPFGDSWPDPCIEFAFKTLIGDIPDAIFQQQQQQPDQTARPNNSSNPYTHTKSGSLDQDEALSHFGLWDDHLWSFRDDDIPWFLGNDLQSTKKNV